MIPTLRGKPFPAPENQRAPGEVCPPSQGAGLRYQSWHQLTGERGQEGGQMALLHGLNLDDRSPGEARRAICAASQNGRVWPQVSHSNSPDAGHRCPQGQGRPGI